MYFLSAFPLKTEGVSFRAMDYSPLLGGFAVVLADGRGGFLSAETAIFDCSVSSTVMNFVYYDIQVNFHEARCRPLITASPLPPLLATFVVTKAAIKLLIHLLGLYFKNMMEENTVQERR